MATPNFNLVPDTHILEKVKSTKFLFVALWTMFVIWGFAVQFHFHQEVYWFRKVLEFSMWINGGYVLVQGVQDLPKASSGPLNSRKVIVTVIQVLFLITGFILEQWIRHFDPSAQALSFMGDLITNAGATIVSLIGVTWNFRDGKLINEVVNTTEDKQ